MSVTSCDGLDETEGRIVVLRLEGRSYREIETITGVNFMTAWHIAQRPHVRTKIDELTTVAVRQAQETLTSRVPELLDKAIGVALGTAGEVTPHQARMLTDLLGRAGLTEVKQVEIRGVFASKSDAELLAIAEGRAKT